MSKGIGKRGRIRGPMVLAGDVGGTKTNLGIFAEGRNRPQLLEFESFSSPEARGMEEIIAAFLKPGYRGIKAACFGVAGPVRNGDSDTTNLPWSVSSAGIQKGLGLNNVRLLNDLEATALSIPLLKAREIVSLNRAKRKSNGTTVVLAPGTGLGVSFLFTGSEALFTIPSEGGHVDFAPQSQEQDGLLRYLRSKYGHVSIERVLSGNGLTDIYEWIKNSGRFSEPAAIRRQLEKKDRAAVISENALRGRCRICTRALDLFVSVLGAAAGNLALTALPQGGIFLGGGIPPKILPALKSRDFLSAFTHKGRFTDLVSKIPLKVILNERAALLGAASAAFRVLNA